MIIKPVKYTLLIAASFLLLSAASCKKAKAQVPEGEQIQINVQQSQDTQALETQNQKWHVTNKRVCVIFGYDFNAPEAVEKFTALLGQRYGLESDGGLIYTLTYPDSFKHGSRGYASELTGLLSGTDRDLVGKLFVALHGRLPIPK